MTKPNPISKRNDMVLVPIEPTDEMVERAGKEYWAQTRHTNGPRTLARWASDDIMNEVYEHARIILREGIKVAARTQKKVGR